MPSPGEFEFLNWVRSQQKPSPLIPIPSGDDMAGLRWPGDEMLLAGIDQVLDGVHFDSTIHSLRQIGRKAMNRNLSDCAAMACLPAAALASVALPKGTTLENVQELYHGLREAADLFDCPIVGGDTGSWPGKLCVVVAILGKPAGIPPITRAGAKPGDGIYVTGPLGGSILGRHMTFTPRVQLARQLAASMKISAMLDISDGLSRDLGHICRMSGVGAVIRAGEVPIHADALELSRKDSLPAIEHALHDGEDYELLFTAGAEPAIAGCVRIGEITANHRILLQDEQGARALEPRGWEHSL